MNLQSLSSSFRCIVGAIAVAFALLSVSANQAPAEQDRNRGGELEGNVSSFLANPGQILAENPDGGTQLISRIQALAVEPATLSPIMGLLPTANAEQKGAIGAALAQAAKTAVLTNQAYATRIQQAIAAANDPVVNLAFTNGLGDVLLGAIGGGSGTGLGGPGAGLGGPGGGPGGQSNAGTPEDTRARFVGTQNFLFTSSTTGTSSGFTTSTSGGQSSGLTGSASSPVSK